MTRTKAPREVAPDLLDRIRDRFGDFPLTRHWDLAIQALAAGRAVLVLVPDEHTTNVPSSEVNGGVLATLADMACALALCTHFDGQMPFVTSDLHIRYLEPALGPVTVEAQVLRRSLRSAVLDCRLTCQGRLAGLCTAHFVIRAGEEAP